MQHFRMKKLRILCVMSNPSLVIIISNVSAWAVSRDGSQLALIRMETHIGSSRAIGCIEKAKHYSMEIMAIKTLPNHRRGKLYEYHHLPLTDRLRNSTYIWRLDMLNGGRMGRGYS